jgi:addiction module RelE/StbE family toxin
MIVFSPDALRDIERLRSFLDRANPDAARRAMNLIFAAIERLQEFPDRGRPTDAEEIRQIVIRFGTSGYIVRYAVVSKAKDVLILRIWHGRESRT